MSRNDKTGRVVGLVTFLVGVGILIFVAVVAYQFFTSASIMDMPAADEDIPVTARLGESAVTLLVKVGLLIVMAIVGSLIAGRGASMYFSSTSSNTTSPAPRE